LRIEQYFQVQDYALWDAIENGNSFQPVAQTTTNLDGTSTLTILVQMKQTLLLELVLLVLRTRNQDTTRRTVNVEDTSSKAMVAIDGVGFDWSYMDELRVEFNKSNYNAVPPPHIGRFSPLKIELSHTGLPEFAKPSVQSYGIKPVEVVAQTSSIKISKPIKRNNDAPLIEDWESDGEDEIKSPVEIQRKTIKPSVDKVKADKPKPNGKPTRRPVKYVEMYRKQRPRGNQRYWNNLKSQQLGSNFVMYNKVCFVCSSYDHVQANCNHRHKDRMVTRNNYRRVNYNYSARNTHPNAHRNMVPRAVLLNTSLQPLSTARPVYTAHRKPIVYSAKPMTSFSKPSLSTVRRPFQNKPTLIYKKFHQKVNTAKGHFNTARPRAFNTARPNATVVNVVRANMVNAVKTSTYWGHPQNKDQGYVDSGCSRHMTGNMSYITNFKEFDGGYVTFGGGSKGGRITSKGTLKTGKLDFEDVYFVKELKFNLLSVLFKVPRKNNMYSVDMKNIIPSETLTFLVTKATTDESMLWHRRLGHINFKYINKFVKENLVRGLPLKHFENDQTYVAYLKGKQHRTSCKSKVLNSNT
ncbi:putative ribonuclease H-like domain-containing protein, partial [Tanacetum coccineum]